MKSRTTAALLAIFLGGFGAHKFYLNQGGSGIVYLLFCWTTIPFFIGIVQGINFLTMTDQVFNATYNAVFNPYGHAQNNQAVTVNLGKDSGNASNSNSVTDELKKLHELKICGAISPEEYELKKKQLL